MPRTWFSWTDSVLLGSNRLFIVSEMTVPGLQARQASGHRDPRAARRRAAARRSSSTASSSACSTPGLRRADIEQALGDRLRRHHPEQLPPRARGDRPRRAARRGQARQQHHAAQLKKLMLAAEEPQSGRKPRRRPGRTQARAGALRQTMFGRFTAWPAASPTSQRRPSRAPAAPSCRRAEAPSLDDWCRSCPSSKPCPSPRRPIRCCATSCSTPRCACIAG